jgi:hypothetical protein
MVWPARSGHDGGNAHGISLMIVLSSPAACGVAALAAANLDVDDCGWQPGCDEGEPAAEQEE